MLRVVSMKVAGIDFFGSEFQRLDERPDMNGRIRIFESA
jgi:hypothetical protein